MNDRSVLRVLVLAGGPDRERTVSLQSGKQVEEALRDAGHEVSRCDVQPNDLSAVDAFTGDVIFPILHGGWGEGGPLQCELDQRGVRYVGCRAEAATLCMDKLATKQLADTIGVRTPAYEEVARGQVPTLSPPVVIKPMREGSSLDMAICHTDQALDRAWKELSPRYDSLLVEQYIAGPELTVGIIGTGKGAEALPVLHIVPATTYYDYAAKYERDDTQYRFDVEPALANKTQEAALQLYREVRGRHLSRVDFMVDDVGEPQMIEINTLPGFTTHSLLPMAAAQAGLPMPKLVDQLVRVAMGD